MDRGAWQGTVHGVSEGRTLSDQHLHFQALFGIHLKFVFLVKILFYVHIVIWQFNLILISECSTEIS